MQKIKGEKGITLVVLVLTIIVLGIVSIPTTLRVSDIIKLNTLTKFKDDFTIINETVSQVYSQGESISAIGPEFTGVNSIPNENKNPNDSGKYRVVNMNKLSNDLYLKVGTTIEILNYGKANYDMSHITNDVYIINEQSRTVYYVAGFEDANGNTIYRYPGSYSPIVIESY